MEVAVKIQKDLSGSATGVSIDTRGVVRYDRSRPCTGQAALAAARTTW